MRATVGQGWGNAAQGPRFPRKGYADGRPACQYTYGTPGRTVRMVGLLPLIGRVAELGAASDEPDLSSAPGSRDGRCAGSTRFAVGSSHAQIRPLVEVLPDRVRRGCSRAKFEKLPKVHCG